MNAPNIKGIGDSVVDANGGLSPNANDADPGVTCENMELELPNSLRGEGTLKSLDGVNESLVKLSQSDLGKLEGSDVSELRWRKLGTVAVPRVFWGAKPDEPLTLTASYGGGRWNKTNAHEVEQKINSRVANSCECYRICKGCLAILARRLSS